MRGIRHRREARPMLQGLLRYLQPGGSTVHLDNGSKFRPPVKLLGKSPATIQVYNDGSACIVELKRRSVMGPQKCPG